MNRWYVLPGMPALLLLAANAFAAPIVSTTPGNASSATTATLNALVDPNGAATSARFDYGLTASYGMQTPLVGVPGSSGSVGFAAPITGLTPGKLYHARVVATNSGGTAIGNDVAFYTQSDSLSVVAWYRMGENDPDLASGTSSATRDGVGSNDLAVGGASYSISIAPAAAAETGSTSAINFFSYIINASGALVSTATDNFGVESWVRIGTGIDNTLLYNGTPGSDGWGIVQSGNQLAGKFGGTLIGATPTLTGQWAHLALVRNNGIATFYVNGVATGSSALAPATPSGGFVLAQQTIPISAGPILDEVRVFTFPSGQFRVDDLLLPSPEVSLEQPAATEVGDGGARDFGTVHVGDQVDRVFTLANIGGGTMSSIAATINGADAAHFSVVGAVPTTLAARSSTTFIVRFAPTTPGAKSAALHVANNDADENPYDVSLAGIGAQPEIVLEQPLGSDVPDGGARDFGNNAVATHADLVFTVRNPGLETLIVSVPTIDGVDAAQFSIFANPGSTVLPGATTSFTVRFAPTSSGNKSAALHIVSNDADENPFDINLTGFATLAEIAVEQPLGSDVPDGGARAFGNVNVGTSVDLVFTVRNVSVENLGVSAPMIDGPDAAHFSIFANPVSPVLPGGTTTFTVRCTPTSTGNKSASVHMANGDPDENPFDITLSATAVQSAIVTTLPAAVRSASVARLHGRFNPAGTAGTVYFEYGPTNTYGSTTPALAYGATAANQAHSVTLNTGLAPGTTYHYRLVAANVTGTSYGADAMFTMRNDNVTVVAEYRMGEIDVDPPGGPTLPMMRDGIGPLDLTVQPGATSVFDVGIGPAEMGSVVGVHGNGSGPRIINAIDNFAIELWTRPTSDPFNKVLAYNGSTIADGWGLFYLGGAYVVGFESASPVFFGNGPVSPTGWDHVALVRDAGVSKLYVNGVEFGTSFDTPLAPSNAFTTAGADIDELRVLTFPPGGFNLFNLNFRSADLTISNSNGTTALQPNVDTVYTVRTSNNGRSVVSSMRVRFDLAPAFTNVSWTCSSLPFGHCPAPFGTGNIDQVTGTMAIGTVLTYLITARPTGSNGTLVTTATVQSLDPDVSENSPANNIAIDSDVLGDIIFKNGFE